MKYSPYKKDMNIATLQYKTIESRGENSLKGEYWSIYYAQHIASVQQIYIVEKL